MKFGRVKFSVCIIKNPLVGDGRERHEGIILYRLPGVQSFFDLFGKHGRVARRFESLLRHLPGNLVIAVAVGATSDKDGSNDERTGHSNNAYYIRKSLIVSPLFERFFFSLGKTKVDHSRPELLHSIVTIGSEKFFRAHQP